MSNTNSPLSIPAASEAPAADPFPSVLTDCESADASSPTSVPALAALIADLVARNNEWVQVALAQVASFRSALLARKTRVLGSAKRLSLKQCKRIVADCETLDVSTEQLRVWSGLAGAESSVCPDLDCAFAASPLLALPCLVQSPTTGISSIIDMQFFGELGSVSCAGDGLRMVSAAGPGLEWFEPRSRNEFSVVLAQADGSVPLWLTTCDVVVDVLSPVGTAAAVGARVGAAAAVHSVSAVCTLGTVNVVYAYGGVDEDVPEVVLQLYVCSVPVTAAAGETDSNWCVHVHRKPLAGHECSAVGTHVTTLAVVEGYKSGMAVSADDKWLVVGLLIDGTLSVYSLPGGELVRTFGSEGDGPLQFNYLRRLCFAPNNNLIVVDYLNQRLQEVTLEGVFVRFIGAGEFGDGNPFCVAVRGDVIAVGHSAGTGPRVVLFDFGTSEMTSRFGEVGTAPGQLSWRCTGIRFTLDGSHVVVAEDDAKRLSLFTVAGVFVRCVGMGPLGLGPKDVLQSVSGEYVVADLHNHRVCVFSPDGSELVRSWGVRGLCDGQFQFPAALAAAGQHLYVMDSRSGRVQVFG